MNSPADIELDTLNLQLPQGFESRAAAIARETARELSRLPLTHSLDLRTLTVPTVHVTGGESDTLIARRIAVAIHRQIATAARQGADHAD